MGRESYTFRDRTIEVIVQDFCYMVWADEEGNGIDAKRVRIVPYSTPIHEGQDQNIRLHIFDDVEGTKEVRFCEACFSIICEHIVLIYRII